MPYSRRCSLMASELAAWSSSVCFKRYCHTNRDLNFWPGRLPPWSLLGIGDAMLAASHAVFTIIPRQQERKKGRISLPFKYDFQSLLLFWQPVRWAEYQEPVRFSIAFQNSLVSSHFQSLSGECVQFPQSRSTHLVKFLFLCGGL